MCLLLRVNYVETHVCRELLLPGWEETFTIKVVDCFELPNPFLSKNLLCQKWPISCLFFHNSSEYKITRYSLFKKLNYLLEHAIWFKWKVEKLISDYKTSRYMYHIELWRPFSAHSSIFQDFLKLSKSKNQSDFEQHLL